MRHTRIAIAITATLASASAGAASGFTSFHEWSFNHTAANGSNAMGSEIVSYDSINNRLWVAGTDANQANIGHGGIDILDLLGNLVNSFSTSALGGINSVAVKNNQAAVAITAPTKTDPGLVRLYNATTFATLADVTVGANPDSLTYTPDGSRLLVANEGEPSSYQVGPIGDPEGSVSIINSSNYAVQTAGFSGFNGSVKKRAKLSRVLGKRALKSFHPRLLNVRFFTGESWSVSNGHYCRNQTASFYRKRDDHFSSGSL